MLFYIVEELQKEFGIKVSFVDLTEDGSVDLTHLEDLLTSSETSS